MLYVATLATSWPPILPSLHRVRIISTLTCTPRHSHISTAPSLSYHVAGILMEFWNGSHLWLDEHIILGNPNEGVSLAEPFLVGLRFPLDVPRNSFILAAFMSFTVVGSESGEVFMVISAENTSNASTLPVFDASSPDPVYALTSRVWSHPGVIWDGVPSSAGRLGHPLSSEDVSELLQEHVNRPEWQPGMYLNFLINGSSGARLVEGDFGHGPELVVYHVPAPAQEEAFLTAFSVITNPSDIKLEVRETDQWMSSSYLYYAPESLVDKSQLLVQKAVWIGLRFAEVNVPSGSTIIDAQIEFEAREQLDVFTSMVLCTELTNDGPPFALAGDNLRDQAMDAGGYLQLRNRSTSVVQWPNVRATLALNGPQVYSPNIAALIEEVTSHQGWTAGGHINVLIDVTAGKRIFYHAGAAYGPALRVQYVLNTPPSPPDSPPVSPLPPPFPPP